MFFVERWSCILLMRDTLAAMQQEQPIYSVQHSRSFFQRINMVISFIVIVMGALSVQESPYLLFLGVGIGGLYWFSTAQKYHLYHDRLVIHYGRPRILEIPLDSIIDAGIIKMPFSGVLIRRAGRAGALVRPRNLEEFVERLWDAIEKNGGPAPDRNPS